MGRLSYIWRDLRIVGRAVWPNLALFTGLLLVSAAILWFCKARPQVGFLTLVLDSFNLAHLERVSELGESWVSVVMTFVLPVLSVIILGEGALRVAAFYLQRRQRREEWDPLVAKTFSRHTVICGLGELGRAIYHQLIEKDPLAHVVLVDSRPGIPGELGQSGPNVLQVQGDMTTRATLEDANCQAASLIILSSGNDAFNLEAGFKAMELNPQAQIWIRLYRKGLASLIACATLPNVHFFSPYERAAESLVGHMSGPGGEAGAL